MAWTLRRSKRKFPARCTQEAGAPKHVKALDDSRALLIGYSCLPGSFRCRSGQQQCSLAWEMSCSVCLDFEHRQLCHCCFCKGTAGAVSQCPQHKAGRISGSHTSPDPGGRCELVPGSLWWLRHRVTTALPEPSLPPNPPEHTLSFYPPWGTSLLFRKWSVLSALLCWPPSNSRR